MGIWDWRFGPLADNPFESNRQNPLQRLTQWILEYFVGQLFTLYRYIHPIAEYQIHYDRKCFGKTVESLAEGYPLYATKSCSRPPPDVDFPIRIRKPIVFQPYFMWAMAIRCACVTFVPYLTEDECLRSWWGIDVWYGRGGMYADISMMLWSNMCALFLKFGLSNRLLDYKFMAVYFMVRDGPEWLHPTRFGLEDRDYEKFRKFRKRSVQMQVFITFTAFPVGVIFQFFVYLMEGFFAEKTVPSVLWFGIYFFWFAYICFLLYGNLIAFSVVAMYLSIKKRRYMTRIVTMERGNRFRWTKFYDSALKLTHLNDELLDYYRVFFWYMSFFFSSLVMIFCNFIYVIFLGRTIPMILRFLIVWVTLVHIGIIQSVIYFSDNILKQNKVIVAFIMRLMHKRKFYSLTLFNRLKIHHLYYELSRAKIAFKVVNGYVLRRGTIVMLMVNISTCALLIYKKQGNREQFGGILRR